MKITIRPFSAFLIALSAMLPGSLRAEFKPATGTEGLFIRTFALGGTTAYAGTSKGVYLSTDTGSTWRKAGTGEPANQVMSLAVSGTTIVAGHLDSGVSVSKDGGLTWATSRKGITGDPDPYSVGIRGDELFAGTIDGLFRSTDGGANWKFEVEGGFVGIATSGTATYALDVGGLLYHSAAAGQPFTEKNKDINNGAHLSVNFAALTAEGDRLYAGSDRAVWRSEDRGATWKNVGYNATSSIYSSIVTGLVPREGLLAASTSSSGIFISGNRGDSWVWAGQGLPIGNSRGVLVLGSRILAGTHAGVYTRALTDLPSSIRRAPEHARTAAPHGPLHALRLHEVRADGKARPQAPRLAP